MRWNKSILPVISTTPQTRNHPVVRFCHIKDLGDLALFNSHCNLNEQGNGIDVNGLAFCKRFTSCLPCDSS